MLRLNLSCNIGIASKIANERFSGFEEITEDYERLGIILISVATVESMLNHERSHTSCAIKIK
jgi:hypothetical protein